MRKIQPNIGTPYQAKSSAEASLSLAEALEILSSEADEPVEQLPSGRQLLAVRTASHSQIDDTLNEQPPRPIPPNWRNDKMLARELTQIKGRKIRPVTVKTIAARCLRQSSGRDVMRNKDGVAYYPPAFCKKIKPEILTLEPFPKDWVSFSTGAIRLRIKLKVFYTIAEGLQKEHSEKFGAYLDGSGKLDDFCSPEAVKMVKQLFQDGYVRREEALFGVTRVPQD